MGKQVAKRQKGGAVAAFDYGADAGAGFEDVKGSDLSIPFLTLLQANSPQVANQDPKGAAAGMIFNSVTRELTDGDEGIPFLPCHKEGPVWVEWVPRTKGGGFVGLHDPASDVVKNGTPIMHPETGEPTRKLRHGENELIETFYIYGLLLEPSGEETCSFAVISFTSTKIKPHRDWVTAMYTLKGKPPIFANRGVVKTVKQVKNNDTFFNYRIEPFNTTWVNSLIDPATLGDLLLEAKEFQNLVTSGMARAAFETERAADGGGDAPGESGLAREDPPF